VKAAHPKLAIDSDLPGGGDHLKQARSTSVMVQGIHGQAHACLIYFGTLQCLPWDNYGSYLGTSSRFASWGPPKRIKYV